MLRLLALTALWVLPLPASGQATAPIIIATGSARLVLPPDRASLTVVIETRASTAAAASSANAQKQAAVLDTLRTLGYSPDQAKAIAFTVMPNVDYDNQSKLIDYEARIEIAVAVPKLDRLGATIDAALSAGGTEIHSIDFTSDSAAAGRRRALQDAVAAARVEAETLARAAGGQLGGLLEVSTIPPLMGRDGGFELHPGVVSQGFAAVGPRDVTYEVKVYTRWQLRLR